MAKTLEEWKDRYYEQQANHTEATGMLAAERDRWIQRAQKAERLIQEHNESCEAACTAQEPRCDCYTSRDLRCPDCPKDWKIETESHARSGDYIWTVCPGCESTTDCATLRRCTKATAPQREDSPR
jgi:hypothetical protein